MGRFAGFMVLPNFLPGFGATGRSPNALHTSFVCQLLDHARNLAARLAAASAGNPHAHANGFFLCPFLCRRFGRSFRGVPARSRASERSLVALLPEIRLSPAHVYGVMEIAFERLARHPA